VNALALKSAIRSDIGRRSSNGDAVFASARLAASWGKQTLELIADCGWPV